MSKGQQLLAEAILRGEGPYIEKTPFSEGACTDATCVHSGCGAHGCDLERATMVYVKGEMGRHWCADYQMQGGKTHRHRKDVQPIIDAFLKTLKPL